MTHNTSKPAASAVADAGTSLNIRDLLVAGEPFDVVLATPARLQLTALAADYPDGPITLDRCLPVHALVAGDAVACVLCRIRDLAVVTTELLPRLGFGRTNRIIPLRAALSAGDLSRVPVLAVAIRGRATIADHNVANTQLDRVNPAMLAQRVAPWAQRRLHVFANAPTPGWTSLLGDGAWFEIPTLRD